MKAGDWVKQVQSDSITYAYLIEPFKSGGFRSVSFTSYDGSMAGHAKFSPTKNWFPQPIVISREEIPERILRKIDHKLTLTRYMR